MTVERLGVGLVGCGGMGRSLAKQLITIDEARLVAVTDVSVEARERAAEELGSPAVESVEALLAAPDLQAVVVATPGFQHRTVLELAASAGKHAFVEKPLAVTSADCDAMISTARDAGITLMVGQVLRFYPCWWKVLELVRQGEIGEPWAITVTRISGWGNWTTTWRKSMSMSGGLLMEVNAHEIDFMTQIGGDVVRVYAEADRFEEDGSDYPNIHFVSLRFAQGAMGHLHSSSVSAVNDLSGKVQGSEGTIVYSNGFGGGGEIRYARKNGTATVIPISEIQIENPVRKELRLFVDCLRNGGPVPIPPEQGRRNVRIAEAAYESARTGQPVAL
jgi:myo-inositol 2-dehydrogenase/D-chiro-inositol 1-dehydrogenase